MRSVLKSLLLTCVLSGALAASVSAVVLTDTNPDGSINTGDFHKFTALTSGDLNDTNNTLTGASLIQGNVGIGGKGNFSMSAGTVNGDIYINNFGKFTKSGPAQHTGSVFTNQDFVLNNALDGARYLSNQAAIDTNTGSYTVTQGSFNGMTENGNKDVTLTGSGHIVLTLQDFVMTGGTFTLSGTAMTSYIINVNRNFSLSGNAKIELGGQLTASHVLFNIIGTGNAVTMQQGT